jgi:hypothetical protein
MGRRLKRERDVVCISFRMVWQCHNTINLMSQYFSKLEW